MCGDMSRPGELELREINQVERIEFIRRRNVMVCYYTVG